MNENVVRAAEAVEAAEALLITAGAGMGVDSGLPDFQGNEGFWRAYPPFAKLGFSFQQLAAPRWFRDDPQLAWGFYGHRLNLYRATTPHDGFEILRRWSANTPRGAFVFTSNVDGQFQRAGFDAERIAECHGSIHFGQCTAPCSSDIWSLDDTATVVEEATMRAETPLPHCPHCGAIARPNILMFGDWNCIDARIETQMRALRDWIADLDMSKLVVVECGAGTQVPTARAMGEQLVRHGAKLIRINPREPQGPHGTISLKMGAMEALQHIDAHLQK